MRRILLAVLLGLGGCSLGPEYRRPDVDVPAGFQATAASARAAWPEAAWWEHFGSDELNGLVARARVYNDDLSAAAARVIQADAQVRISGAPLLPTLDATAGASYARTGVRTGSRGGGLPGGREYVDTRTYSGGLQASYDLDLWGKNRAALAAAEASALATRFDQQSVALTVETSVASTYFQLLAAQDRLRVAEENLRIAERVLGAYRARLGAGTASLLDVSQQEALVAGQRALLPSYRNTIEQNRLGLGILVGLAPERVAVSGGSLERLALPEVGPGLPSELLRRRPDVATAEAQLQSQNANIAAARAAFFPDVSLTGSGGVESAALSAITGPGTLLLQLAANATQPIFDNGLRAGQLLAARGRYAELAADYERAVLQAFTDVEQSLVAYRLTTEQEAREREAVAVAQRASDIANAQVLAGTSDIITSLTTETTLFSDEDALTQVRLARFQALLNVYKALGGGFDVGAARP